jgi:carboxymethylenebutenolidase
MAAARFPAIRAGVAWYGRLSRPKPDSFLGKEERPWPLDIVRQLRAPVLGLYAGEDQGIPQSDVDAMEQAMTGAGKKGEIVVYPGARHGFHADYREQYDAKAAQDGWARMLAFLAANGVAAGKRRSVFDNRR